MTEIPVAAITERMSEIGGLLSRRSSCVTATGTR
jgi:hypothetical protein